VSRPPLCAALFAALWLLGGAQPASADPVEPPAVAQVHQLLAIGSLLCTEAPARDCIELGWRFADADADDTLSLAELRAVRSGFLDWAGQVEGNLAIRDRIAFNLARTLAATVPLAPLFALYDADDDGRLDRSELLADVRLDERPLATILMDREATDWTAIRARLGRAGALLGLLGVPD